MVRKSSRWDNDTELAQRREAFNKTDKQPQFQAASPEAIIARQDQMRRLAGAEDEDQSGSGSGGGAVNGSHALTVPSAQTPIATAAAASAGNAHGFAVAHQVHRVPLALIDANPQNSRHGYTTGEIDDMRRDLALAGRQLSPLSLEEYHTQAGETRYYCIDGWTRAQAMRLDGWVEAEATFTGTLTPLERYKRSIIANDATRHTTDFDHGMMWTKLINEDKVSRQQIIDTVGDRRASPSTLSKVLSIAKLPASVVKLIGENKFVVANSKYYLIYQMYEAFKKKHGDERAEEMIFEKTQLVVADPSYTVDRLEEETKYAADEGSESGGAAGSPGSAGTGQTSGQAPVKTPEREWMLTRMGMGVGKIVRPEKGGLKIAIDKRLPKEVVDQIHDAVTRIIEGQAQG